MRAKPESLSIFLHRFTLGISHQHCQSHLLLAFNCGFSRCIRQYDMKLAELLPWNMDFFGIKNPRGLTNFEVFIRTGWSKGKECKLDEDRRRNVLLLHVWAEDSCGKYINSNGLILCLIPQKCIY